MEIIMVGSRNAALQKKMLPVQSEILIF